MPFVSVRYPLARKGILSIEEFARAPLILREANGRVGAVETALRQAAGRRIKANIALRCQSSEAVKTAVKLGLGVGLLSRSHMARGAEREFRILRVAGLSLEISRFIIYRKDRTLSPAARAFVEILRSYRPVVKVQAARRSSPIQAPAGVKVAALYRAIALAGLHLLLPLLAAC